VDAPGRVGVERKRGAIMQNIISNVVRPFADPYWVTVLFAGWFGENAAQQSRYANAFAEADEELERRPIQHPSRHSAPASVRESVRDVIEDQHNIASWYDMAHCQTITNRTERNRWRHSWLGSAPRVFQISRDALSASRRRAAIITSRIPNPTISTYSASSNR
jgi:hypothetical protein